jgi:hypothetical protein
MRRVATSFGFLAFLGLAVGSAQAGGLWLDWTYNTNTSPTATTNGVWWIDTGSGPTLLPFDVNVEVLAGTSLGNLGLMYPNTSMTPPAGPPSIWLLSDGTANNDIVFNGPGLCCPLSPQGEWWYQVPGTNHYTGESADWFDVMAWTGNDTTYEAAYAASAAGQAVYVAHVTFQNPTGDPINVPAIPHMSNSPAVVLQRGLLGDANMDGTVDINDLSKVLTNYDKTNMQWADGDFDGSGTVDIQDLSKILTNYDKTAGASAGIKAVPEPSALVLLGVSAIGLVRYAQRRKQGA